MSKVILYSAFHKPYIAPKAEWVIPVHAGKALSNTDLSIQGDDTGDNISKLNPIYCELTMAYWIWKNADRSLCDYWGLMHYRRYLLPQTLWTKLGKRKTYHFSQDQSKLDAVFSKRLREKIENDLSKVDIILPLPLRLNKKDRPHKSIEQHYCEEHLPLHWDILKEVVIDKYPEYRNSLSVFERNTFYTFNMMIASWKVWDGYLGWLFDILDEVFKQVEEPDEAYQKRFAGFLGERLLNLYIYHNNLRVKSYLTAEFK